jgi:hypothetical protein
MLLIILFKNEIIRGLRLLRIEMPILEVGHGLLGSGIRE